MKELLPRERFIRTLRHEPVDRVSVLYRMKAEAKQKISDDLAAAGMGAAAAAPPTTAGAHTDRRLSRPVAWQAGHAGTVSERTRASNSWPQSRQAYS